MIREVAEREGARRRRQGIGRAAVLIGVITVFARLVGFGRQVVFAHTVGTTCLGTAYTTANMVPNIIYDVVLGGALSSVVVPVLSGPAGLAALGTDGAARRIASALLTWTVLLLVPVSAVLALAAHPIVRALLSGAPECPHAALTGVGARMLIVFAPQVPLYGLAVVLYGILQSHRRFGAPALAPLLSSLVVIGAYAAFGAVGGAYVDRLDELPPLAEYLLSGGTTLGVLALVLTAVVPAWRLGVAARPTLRFPAGVGTRVRRLALAGVVTLVAQDASVAVVIVLANHYGAAGSLVIYGFAWAVFVVPYAVLAVPIATSAFPELSATSARFAAASADAELSAQLPPRGRRAGATGTAAAAIRADVVAEPDADRDADQRFDLTAAASTRAVMLASWLGAAVLLGAREPISRVFESRSPAAAGVLALALAAFAPGLVGYGLCANLSRVLYAHRRNRAPALAIGGGWVLVILADLLIVPFVPAGQVVPALGLGTTFGLTVAGSALLVLVHAERGPMALHRVPRAFLAGLAGCVAGAVAGSAVASLTEGGAGTGLLANLAISALVTVVAWGVFGVVVLRLDGGDLRTALSRLRSRRSDVEAVSP
jgi:peptidoglycan biosynthesis protein MviN/MurJ (putative lipid II flippase)